MLLNDGNFFWRHFNAEIAASDHDSVGHFENFFQMIDSLRFFELGDDGHVASVRRDDLLDHADIGGGADEGKCDRVNTVAEAEFEVFAVFSSERRDGEGDSGKIDALVLAERAAVDDVTHDVFAAVFSSHGAHAQFDQAVAEKDAGAGREFAGEIGERGGDAGGGAGYILRRDGYHRTGS